MSTKLPEQPTDTERKKMTGLRVFLIFLAVLLVLTVIGFTFWDIGESPNP